MPEADNIGTLSVDVTAETQPALEALEAIEGRLSALAEKETKINIGIEKAETLLKFIDDAIQSIGELNKVAGEKPVLDIDVKKSITFVADAQLLKKSVEDALKGKFTVNIEIGNLDEIKGQLGGLSIPINGVVGNVTMGEGVQVQGAPVSMQGGGTTASAGAIKAREDLTRILEASSSDAAASIDRVYKSLQTKLSASDNPLPDASDRTGKLLNLINRFGEQFVPPERVRATAPSPSELAEMRKATGGPLGIDALKGLGFSRQAAVEMVNNQLAPIQQAFLQANPPGRTATQKSPLALAQEAISGGAISQPGPVPVQAAPAQSGRTERAPVSAPRSLPSLYAEIMARKEAEREAIPEPIAQKEVVPYDLADALKKRIITNGREPGAKQAFLEQQEKKLADLMAAPPIDGSGGAAAREQARTHRDRINAVQMSIDKAKADLANENVNLVDTPGESPITRPSPNARTQAEIDRKTKFLATQREELEYELANPQTRPALLEAQQNKIKGLQGSISTTSARLETLHRGARTDQSTPRAGVMGAELGPASAERDRANAEARANQDYVDSKLYGPLRSGSIDLVPLQHLAARGEFKNKGYQTTMEPVEEVMRKRRTREQRIANEQGDVIIDPETGKPKTQTKMRPVESLIELTPEMADQLPSSLPRHLAGYGKVRRAAPTDLFREAAGLLGGPEAEALVDEDLARNDSVTRAALNANLQFPNAGSRPVMTSKPTPGSIQNDERAARLMAELRAADPALARIADQIRISESGARRNEIAGETSDKALNRLFRTKGKDPLDVSERAVVQAYGQQTGQLIPADLLVRAIDATATSDRTSRGTFRGEMRRTRDPNTQEYVTTGFQPGSIQSELQRIVGTILTNPDYLEANPQNADLDVSQMGFKQMGAALRKTKAMVEIPNENPEKSPYQVPTDFGYLADMLGDIAGYDRNRTLAAGDSGRENVFMTTGTQAMSDAGRGDLTSKGVASDRAINTPAQMARDAQRTRAAALRRAKNVVSDLSITSPIGREKGITDIDFLNGVLGIKTSMVDEEGRSQGGPPDATVLKGIIGDNDVYDLLSSQFSAENKPTVGMDINPIIAVLDAELKKVTARRTSRRPSGIADREAPSTEAISYNAGAGRRMPERPWNLLAPETEAAFGFIAEQVPGFGVQVQLPTPEPRGRGLQRGSSTNAAKTGHFKSPSISGIRLPEGEVPTGKDLLTGPAFEALAPEVQAELRAMLEKRGDSGEITGYNPLSKLLQPEMKEQPPVHTGNQVRARFARDFPGEVAGSRSGSFDASSAREVVATIVDQIMGRPRATMSALDEEGTSTPARSILRGEGGEGGFAGTMNVNVINWPAALLAGSIGAGGGGRPPAPPEGPGEEPVEGEPPNAGEPPKPKEMARERAKRRKNISDRAVGTEADTNRIYSFEPDTKDLDLEGKDDSAGRYGEGGAYHAASRMSAARRQRILQSRKREQLIKPEGDESYAATEKRQEDLMSTLVDSAFAATRERSVQNKREAKSRTRIRMQPKVAHSAEEREAIRQDREQVSTFERIAKEANAAWDEQNDYVRTRGGYYGPRTQSPAAIRRRDRASLSTANAEIRGQFQDISDDEMAPIRASLRAANRSVPKRGFGPSLVDLITAKVGGEGFQSQLESLGKAERESADIQTLTRQRGVLLADKKVYQTEIDKSSTSAPRRAFLQGKIDEADKQLGHIAPAIKVATERFEKYSAEVTKGTTVMKSFGAAAAGAVVSTGIGAITTGLGMAIVGPMMGAVAQGMTMAIGPAIERALGRPGATAQMVGVGDQAVIAGRGNAELTQSAFAQSTAMTVAQTDILGQPIIDQATIEQGNINLAQMGGAAWANNRIKERGLQGIGTGTGGVLGSFFMQNPGAAQIIGGMFTDMPSVLNPPSMKSVYGEPQGGFEPITGYGEGTFGVGTPGTLDPQTWGTQANQPTPMAIPDIKAIIDFSKGMVTSTEQIDALNIGLERGGESVMKFTNRGDLYADQLDAQSEAVKKLGPDAEELAKNIKEGKVAIIGANGELETNLGNLGAALTAVSIGTTRPDLETMLRGQKQAIENQFWMEDTQGQRALGTGAYEGKGLIESQFGIEMATNPVGSATSGIAKQDRKGLGKLKEDYAAIDQAAAKGITTAKAFVSTAGAEFNATLDPTVVDEFNRALDSTVKLGNEISTIQIGRENAHAEYAVKQYNLQLFQMNRSYKDAINLRKSAFGSGGSGLGGIQGQQWALQRESTSLGLGMSQKQINFQTATVGLTVAGETPEMRAARIKQRKLEAEYAQKQLDIQVKLYGLEGKAFKINVDRSVYDLSRQIGLLTEGRAITIDDVKAQKKIKALNIEMGKEMKIVNQIFNQAQTRANDMLDLTGKFANELVKDAAIVFNQLLSYYRRYYEMLPRGDSNPTPIGGNTRKTEGFAGGALFTATSETDITVGEAGTETVAVLRNPRNVTPNGAAGGPAPIVLTVNFNNAKVRNDEDLRTIAREVERIMGQRVSLLFGRNL